MKVLGQGFSVSGPQRAVNEDVLYIDNAQQIFIVADGMGGHVGGAKASQVASETASKFLIDSFDLDSTVSSGQDLERWEKYLRDAVSSASQTVHKLATDHEAFRGMGTTLTSLVHRDGNGLLAHVGDSRLYLYRGGVLYQLTHDHTIVAEMLAAGKITPSQVPGHPFAHVLTRAVGTHEAVSSETLVFELAIGDRLLMCSDGFYDLFEGHDELLSFFARTVALLGSSKRRDISPK